ncbi:uncharacterized protein EI90DRAFT_3091578 [Cantharellus anzutake]|uniref:uncharacterized protein n=1 Tax=Cantharellus anzutake TaxID=1750568 RepID=UPI001903E7DB|nr:uncharacterized protein EI90DRAFT_3091578 [Cantharellus anzutake]KAF8313717.1 hypothetical protein EI90DRAFT_3091578 [Cantharellus anzutake]
MKRRSSRCPTSRRRVANSGHPFFVSATHIITSGRALSKFSDASSKFCWRDLGSLLDRPHGVWNSIKIILSAGKGIHHFTDPIAVVEENGSIDWVRYPRNSITSEVGAPECLNTRSQHPEAPRADQRSTSQITDSELMKPKKFDIGEHIIANDLELLVRFIHILCE